MEAVTFDQMADKVERDLDLEDEVFITRTELLGYANEGIHEAEATILRICEDYFLDQESLTLVSGQADYTPPAGFFADKIREIVYAYGTRVYPVRRMRYQSSFQQIAREGINPTTGGDYRYLMINNATSGRKIRLYPTPAEAGARMTIWGIRSAKKLAVDSDVVDIPEFHSYIEQFMKMRCYEKEGHPNLGTAVRMLEALKQSMIETLSNRFPDNDDLIEGDFSFYEEHS